MSSLLWKLGVLLILNCVVLEVALIADSPVARSESVKANTDAKNDGVSQNEKGEKKPSAEEVKKEHSAKEAQNQTKSNGQETWHYIVIVASLLIAIISLIVTFWLYRWRRIILSRNQHLLVPEAWGRVIEENNKKVARLSKTAERISKRLVSGVEQQSIDVSSQLDNFNNSIGDMTSTFITFKKQLDEKDVEIARLREGYDAHIYQRFIYRFSRVHQSLHEIMAEGEISSKDAKYISDLFDDALEECGVISFKPDTGSLYHEMGDQVSKDPKVINTENPKLDMTIKSVDMGGYKLSSGEKEIIIIPAQVTIFSYKN